MAAAKPARNRGRVEICFRYLLDCLVAYAAAEAPELQFPALTVEDATAMFRIENGTAIQ